MSVLDRPDFLARDLLSRGGVLLAPVRQRGCSAASISPPAKLTQNGPDPKADLSASLFIRYRFGDVQ